MRGIFIPPVPCFFLFFCVPNTRTDHPPPLSALDAFTSANILGHVDGAGAAFSPLLPSESRPGPGEVGEWMLDSRPSITCPTLQSATISTFSEDLSATHPFPGQGEEEEAEAASRGGGGGRKEGRGVWICSFR